MELVDKINSVAPQDNIYDDLERKAPFLQVGEESQKNIWYCGVKLVYLQGE